MHFCAIDGMWLCLRCTVYLGLADPAPRCPRCYSALVPKASKELVGEGAQTEVGSKGDRKMNRHTGRVSTLGFALWLIGGMALAQDVPKPAEVGQQALSAAEAPLTNADVVKLSKLDLGDQVVIAKINESKAVAFTLDTDSLVVLKQDGVSKGVITAMLQRATPAHQSVASQEQANRPAAGPGVVIRTENGELSLAKMAGSVDYRLGGIRTYHVFGGAQSRTRTHDRNPSLLLTSDADPRGQYFLVRCDSSAKKAKRSVRVGGGLVGMRGATAPNEDCIVEYEASQGQPGVWTLKPLKPLEPGEYGLFVVNSNVLSAGDLYDFGVD